MSTDSSSLNPETDYRMSNGFIVTFCAVNSVASFFNIVINSTLIYMIVKLKLLNNVSYRFIICLSLSDLCVGIIVQPILSLRISTNDQTAIAISRVVLLVCGVIFAQTSFAMTTMISLDRYLRLKYLLRYNLHMTKRRSNLLIGATIIISILTSVFLSMGAINNLAGYVTTLWLSMATFTLCVIVVFYVRAYISIKNRVADTSFNSAANASNHDIQRPDIQFIKGMMFILIALLVFYVPYEIASLMVFFLPNQSEETKLELQYIYYCCLLLLYFISSYNGIILIMFDGKLRKFFKRNILRRFLCREG